MNSIGQTIKNERLKKGIKQMSLAKGICSISYLSKIENSLTLPSDDVLRLLLKKLDIIVEGFTSEDEAEIISKVFSCYKNGVLFRNAKDIQQKLIEFTQQNNIFSKLDNFYSYNLYIIRLNLMINETSIALNLINNIKSLNENLNGKQRFIFNLDSGLYYYLEGYYYEALIELEKPLEYLQDINLEEWQLADYYNALSSTYLQNYDYSKSIFYALKSLSYFKNNLYYERSIDLYINIGIAYKKKSNYEKSEYYFSLAQRLASDFKLTKYYGAISQNIGSLYSTQQQHEKAIESYKLSLKYKKNMSNTKGYFITILSIIKEYSKQNRSTQVVKWCKRGLNELNNMSGTEKFKISYVYHYEIYKLLHEKDLSNLENTLKRAIKFYEKNHDQRHAQKYIMLLADNLYKNCKFKEAGFYYQQSHQILLINKNITTWEDF